jgi:hypothetical protein
MVLISNLTEKSGVRYLAVRLTGTTSNRSALGTVVRVTAGGTTYVKVMDGSTGYLSHGVYPLYFGLGSAAGVDSIEVTWPNGTKQAVPLPVTLNSTIEVREGG